MRKPRGGLRIDGNVIPITDNVNVLGGEDKRFANVRTVNLGVTGLISQTGDSLTNVGLTFAANGNATFYQEVITTGKTRANENIDLASNFINGTGNDNEGLSFDGSGNATLAQELTTTGKIRANENIDLGANFINGDGNDNEGLSFTGTGVATFAQRVNINGNVDLASNYLSGDGTNAGLDFGGGTNATFSDNITVSGTTTISGYVKTGNAILLKDPVPGAVPTAANYATIYIDSGDGDLKVRFADGHIATIAADS